MYHYVYQITCPTTNMSYIGVRTSKCLPEYDIHYWGSSKHLPIDVKFTHVKTVLAIFFTRKDAVSYEIYLHALYDVATNPMFYNKAKQTSTGFDTTGVALSPEHAERTRKQFLGRKHKEETKRKLSEINKGKYVSEKAKRNMSIAQKAYAASPNYVNPNKGKPLSDETKKKLSKSLVESGHSKSTNNPKFTPWFITDLEQNVTWLYYDMTKEEYAISMGIPYSTIKSAFKHCKGIKPVGSGPLANKIIGNIPNTGYIPPIRIARSWFITYPDNYTEVFYYTSISEHAKQLGINPQSISDAIHASKGIKPMKGGYFKGLILGRINKDIV